MRRQKVPFIGLKAQGDTGFNGRIQKLTIVRSRTGNFASLKIGSKIWPSLHIFKHPLHRITINLLRVCPKSRLDLLLKPLHVSSACLGNIITPWTGNYPHGTSRTGGHAKKTSLIGIVPIISEELFLFPPAIRHQIKNGRSLG